MTGFLRNGPMQEKKENQSEQKVRPKPDKTK